MTTGTRNADRSMPEPALRELFYDWSKALHLKETQARTLLRALEEQNSPQAAELEKKIRRAKTAGFHNLSLARLLWEEILIKADGDSSPGANSSVKKK
jgi:hypothetical protein